MYYELISTLFCFVIDFCYKKSGPHRKEVTLKIPFILIFCRENNSSLSARVSCSYCSLKQNALYTVSEHIREKVDAFCTDSLQTMDTELEEGGLNLLFLGTEAGHSESIQAVSGPKFHCPCHSVSAC